MELKDFLFTPITLLAIYILAYLLRNRVTDQLTYRYFIPGLTVKLTGALALGLIYQFYYQGGDTFNYFDQSRVIHDAIMKDPLNGLRLLLATGKYEASTFNYASQIYWYRSPSEYFIIKLAAVFGLFNDHCYSSIAILFGTFCFSGVWALYHSFKRIAPQQHLLLALAILFVPSVFFWGSGLMKDTITLGALGWMFYGFHRGLIEKRLSILTILTIAGAFYIIFQVKIYILLSFLPPAIYWVFLENSKHFNLKLLRFIIRPLMVILGVFLAYQAAINVTRGDIKYDISNIAERTKINAEYIYRISLLQEGSAYYLGELDGSIVSMLKIAPKAINVTLFRPYLWEIANPLMLLSALESLVFTLLFIGLLIKPGLWQCLWLTIQQPVIQFCMVFTIILAFAVGLNSYNFGTLVRYKIQLLPFFLSGMVLLKHFYSLSTTHSNTTRDEPQNVREIYEIR